MSKTPDELVADRITNELLKLGVLEADRAKRFAIDLAAGNMKIADWNLLADVALDQGPVGKSGE